MIWDDLRCSKMVSSSFIKMTQEMVSYQKIHLQEPNSQEIVCSALGLSIFYGFHHIETDTTLAVPV